MNEKYGPTLVGRPRPTRAVLGALVLLGLARGIFLFFPDFETVEVDNIRLRRFYEKELNYRAAGSPSPKVVVFGTSRLIGLRHRQLIQGLNYDYDEILSLSLPGNDFWYTRAFLRRNPSVLTNCELFIVDLLPLQLYGATMRREDDSTFLRHATIAEKLNTRTVFHRVLGISDAILPVRSQRMRVDNWRRAYTHRAYDDQKKLEHLQTRPVSDFAQLRRMAKTHKELGESGRIALVLSTLFPRSNIIPSARKALDEICNIVPDECTIAMISIPVRTDVQEIIESNEIWKDSHDSYLRFISAYTRPNIVKLFYRKPADFNLADADYGGDGVHFTDNGKLKLSLSIGLTGNNILAARSTP